MNPQPEHPIQPQVTLPISIAMEVVLQGIRIRMGRSIVTMMGVVLGVAFLMSVFCTNAIRSGMTEERSIRNELARMIQFLQADAGEIRNQSLVVLAGGTLSPLESRLLRALDQEQPESIQILSPGTASLPGALTSARAVETPAGLNEQSAALLLLGDAQPDALLSGEILRRLPVPVAASLRNSHLENLPSSTVRVPLTREVTEEERIRTEQLAQQARVRNIWIVTIALLVTVIGITNSLLMSVTERFKEIGTMKCLGALSSFIRQIFFIESALTGLVGSLLGGLVGFLIAAVLYSITYGFSLVIASIPYASLAGYYLLSVVCGVAMSILAAIYPAAFASRMVPADALRTNI
jgi:ABC-type antimicrobial peptide transport system permease subunit